MLKASLWRSLKREQAMRVIVEDCACANTQRVCTSFSQMHIQDRREQPTQQGGHDYNHHHRCCIDHEEIAELMVQDAP
jgi:hypothetical protein